MTLPIDDILKCIRYRFPDEMKKVDAMLFNAGATKDGKVISGAESIARAVVVAKIPDANTFFFGQ